MSAASFAQHSTALDSMAQHSTAWSSTAQHSTALNSMGQHSTAQHDSSKDKHLKLKVGIVLSPPRGAPPGPPSKAGMA